MFKPLDCRTGDKMDGRSKCNCAGAESGLEVSRLEERMIDQLCESWNIHKNSRNDNVTKSTIANLWDWYRNELKTSQHNIDQMDQSRLYKRLKRKLSQERVAHDRKTTHSRCDSTNARQNFSNEIQRESLSEHGIDPGINSQYLRVLSSAGICIEDADDIVIVKLMRGIVNQCNILNLSRDMKMVKFKIQLLLFNDRNDVNNEELRKFLNDVSDSSVINVYSHERAYVIAMRIDGIKAISEEKLEGALRFQPNIDVNQLVTFILKNFSGTRDTDASRRRRIVLYMFHTLYCVLYSFIEWLRSQSPKQGTRDSIDKYIYKSFGFVRR
uniref:Uncharacterized protein n=1 Tax=Glypta fumiferanae TaxID=389681 RepID=A0A0F6T1D3_9HYME|nr:hypothetical protein [Glypta fumiferanae]